MTLPDNTEFFWNMAAASPPPPSPQRAPRIQTSHAIPRKRRSQWPIWTGVGGIALIAGVTLLFWFGGREPRAERTTPPSGPAASDVIRSDLVRPDNEQPSERVGQPAADGPRGWEDTTALWQSPTQGAPISLDHLPQGGRCFIQVAMKDVMSSVQAQRTLRGLGPSFADAMQRWERDHGILLADQVELLFMLVPSASGKVSVVVRGRPGNDWSPPASWIEGTTVAAGTQYRIDSQQALVTRSAGTRYWIIGDADLIKEIAETNHPTRPVLRRQLEQLRRRSDQDRQLSLLSSANFLWRYGAEVLGPTIEPVLAGIERETGDGLQALLLSLHVEDEKESHIELQTVWRTEASASTGDGFEQLLTRMLANLQQRVNSPRGVDRYWADLYARLPRMLDFVKQHVRVQREDRVLVANASLPPPALHNLTLAGELLLAANLTTASVVEQEAASLSLWETKLTYGFDQLSLVDALRGLEEEVQRAGGRPAAFSIKVDGAALKADGITRNQQIKGFRLEDSGLAEILTALVTAANPGQVESPSDSGQKLVWVAMPHEPDVDSTVILITTRQVARASSFDLPDVFLNP